MNALATAAKTSDDMQSHDSFRTYLYEISKTRVLTKEEEIETALRIKRHGDRAAEQKLVTGNLRLVVKIAMDYHRFHLNILDLIQEGNVGLLRAVRKYDPDRGTRFSTYASFWIRAYILKYLMDSWSIVKVGTKDSQRKLFFSLNKEKEKLERAGIAISSNLLAENLDVSIADIDDMEIRLTNGDVSLDEALYEGGEELVDTIASGEDVEEVVSEKQRMEMLREKMAHFKKLLDEKERYILEHRIMAEDPVTLREIGERFNTSRESIRQLQAKISKNLTRNLRASMAWS
jgi:RNA polymerase sigma-32 factor